MDPVTNTEGQNEMSEQTFNATGRLRSIQGQAYLPASARKLWFIEENPSYEITTVAHTITPQIAVFTATVTILADGGAVRRKATGWGSETPGDFGDYIEKAETKALSRALDNLGYGTAAALDDDDVISDAPVQRGGGGYGGGSAPRSGGGGNPGAPTEKQVAYLSRLCNERGIDPEERFGKLPALMDRNECSRAIDSLVNSRPNVSQQQREAANDWGGGGSVDEVPY